MHLQRTTLTRGVSEVVGAVLLLGIIVMVSGTLAYTGGEMIQNLESQSQNEQIESELTVLSNNLRYLESQGQAQTTLNLQALPQDLDTSQINITVSKTTANNTTELFNTSYNSLAYTQDSSTYYINTGVFKIEDNFSTVISQPPIKFNQQTLTLSLLNVTTPTSQTQLNPQNLQLQSTNTDTQSFNTKNAQTLTLTIQGKSYQGYATLLQQQSNTNININHQTNTVTVELSETRYVISSLNQITATNSLSISGSGRVNGDIATKNYQQSGRGGYTGERKTVSSQYTSLTTQINKSVQHAKQHATPLNPNGTKKITAGYYYVDNDFNPQAKYYADAGQYGEYINTLNLDASQGNVTIIVNGSYELSDGQFTLNITNTTDKNRVRFVVAGNNYQISGNTQTTVQNAKTHHTVFSHPNITAKFNGHIDWDGIFYAPQSTTEITTEENNNCQNSSCITGSARINGGIVSDNVKISGRGTLTYTQTSKHQHSQNSHSNKKQTHKQSNHHNTSTSPIQQQYSAKYTN